MIRRPFLRVLLLALLGLQVAVLPVAPAFASAVASASTAGCATDAGPAKSDCPCCPEGLPLQGMCNVPCATAVAVVPQVAIPVWHITRTANTELAALPFASLTYSPINPPPIG